MYYEWFRSNYEYRRIPRFAPWAIQLGNGKWMPVEPDIPAKVVCVQKGIRLFFHEKLILKIV